MKYILALCLVFLAISAVYSLDPPTGNIIEVAEANSLTTLVDLIFSAGLDGTLNQTDPKLTVFAPTNAAFARLTPPPTGAALANLLKYHVYDQEEVLSGAVTDNSIITSAEGTNFFLNKKGDNVYINGINVTTRNVLATNGVAHVIDTVLSLPTKGVSETAEDSGFSTLVNLLRAAELFDLLDGFVVINQGDQSAITVFAPTNAAFAKVPAEAISYLVANKTALTQLLAYHVVPQTIFSSFIASGPVQSLGRQDLRIDVKNNGDIFVGRAGQVNSRVDLNQADILATNGVIHVIDRVMVPPGLFLPSPPNSASTISLSVALIFAAIALAAVAL